jgi:hypothetical protein
MSHQPIGIPPISEAALTPLSCESYLKPLPLSPPVQAAAIDGDTTMTRKKEKMEMPVCARVSASKFRTLEVWCDNSFRKRSEVVGMVLERVLDMVEQQANVEQPVEDFIRRLRADRTE